MNLCRDESSGKDRGNDVESPVEGCLFSNELTGFKD